MKRLSLGTIALLALAACGGDRGAGPTTPRASVASIDVRPAAVVVAVGATQQLTATLYDASKNVLAGRAVAWQSGDVTTASVGASGAVTGVRDGVATITATSEGVSASVAVTVGTPAAPTIAGVAPSVLTPGANGVMITGTNFAPAPSANVVTVDGVAATVTAATPTALTVSLPASGFACRATRDVAVTVTSWGVKATTMHPLRVANQLALNPGAHALVLDLAKVRCNELPVTNGRYVLAVYNTEQSVSSDASFTLYGEGATAGPQAVIPGLVVTSPEAAILGVRPAPLATTSYVETPSERAQDEMYARHVELLEQSARLLARAPLVAPGTTARATSGARAMIASTAGGITPTLGAINRLNVPNWNIANTVPTASGCAYPLPVAARTVYSGSRVMVLEDTLSPVRGQIDDLLAEAGRRLDDVQYDIVARTFGDPLLVDDRVTNPVFLGDALPGTGKVVVLVSPSVNAQFPAGSIGGFVSSCDFINPGWVRAPSDTLYRASNKTAVIYVTVPFSTSRGLTGPFGNPDWWRATMAFTLVHELKHVASYAAGIKAGLTSSGQFRFEESWLEEGTAVHAQELYWRTLSGGRLRGNATYDASLYCERTPRLIAGTCEGRPQAMIDAPWQRLYRHLSNVERNSMLGDGAANTGTGAWYGASWAFVRWLIDQSAGDDAAFLGALTREPMLTGVANVEARAGRSFAELLGEWSLALAVDDRPGFTPASPRITMPSWNLVDVFGGAYADPLVPAAQNYFKQPYPLVPHAISYPSFLQSATVRGGSAAYFELSGTQSAGQLLEVRGPGGGDPPRALRLAIVRVQ